MSKILDLYQVTVLGWTTHNSKKKKQHTHIMLSTRFWDDSKIVTLTVRQRVLYLWLLTRCGDEARGTIEFTTSGPRVATELKPSELHDALWSLQRNQLVSIQKSSSLIKRKEEKIKEEKIKEVPAGSDGPPPAPIELVPDEPPKPKPNTEANRKVWDAYRQEYQKRYKVEPVRNAKTNSAVASFVKRIGEEEAAEVVRFFVWHNDAYYLKSTHSIGLALKDAESLRTQWLKGKAITMRDVRDFERQDGYAEQMRKIEAGEI